MKVISVNVSEVKGTRKKPVDSINIDEQGVISDAHAGFWNRQVSLLGIESIAKFAKQAHLTFQPGEFAENITTEGFELFNCQPLDRLCMGETELEVTQIGKACHGDGCAIFREVGHCVMPKEGVFCRVLKGGKVSSGDTIMYSPRVMRVFVITLSDRAFRGEYEDRSGPYTIEQVQQFFGANGYQCIVEHHIIPDNRSELHSMLQGAKNLGFDVVFTTGGTGIGPRDITPDVTRTFLDKEIPGVMEMIRLKYGEQKPKALLSRALAGVMGNTLVFNMPGSVKAVQEYTTEIFKSLRHMIYMIHSLDLH